MEVTIDRTVVCRTGGRFELSGKVGATIVGRAAEDTIGLKTVENLAMGTNLSECHTGYRAYSRELLQTVPFLRNSNDFVFDTQMIFQAHNFGYRFAEVPVNTSYSNKASSISFGGSVKYGLQTLVVAARYLLHRLGIPNSEIFEPAHRDRDG